MVLVKKKYVMFLGTTFVFFSYTANHSQNRPRTFSLYFLPYKSKMKNASAAYILIFLRCTLTSSHGAIKFTLQAVQHETIRDDTIHCL